MHDDDVVARVGTYKLYKTELASIVPPGLSPEDSTALAHQYIDSWAQDMVYLEIAEKELSKEEKDVSTQLEDYRRALLKFRYEQRYVNERLDTAVSDSQIRKYYENHSDSYTLNYPIVKARFMRIAADSPDVDRLKAVMSSSDESEYSQMDSLAFGVAEKYTDFGESWIDVSILAREFGEDYASLLSRMSGSFIQSVVSGRLNIAFVEDILYAGTIPPEEYCAGRIRDVILSVRKQELVSALERDLLKQARDKGDYVIY